MEATKDYLAAINDCAYFIFESGGILRVSGEDQIDFIQRQSTNDVEKLNEETTITTVLTSPVGRILDVLTLVKMGDAIGVMTLPGNGEKTAAYLKGKIFFMDKVTVEDMSSEFIQIDLEGPQAGAVLASLGVKSAPHTGEAIRFEVEGEEVNLIGRTGLTGEIGWRAICPTSKKSAFVERIQNAGAVSLSFESYETLRVEAGLPGPATELTDAYTPLEMRLRWAVSTTKGCYTGQEVIARQINYDKITKQMVQLKLSGAAILNAAVRADGKNVGEITSTVNSPRLGEVALAVIKRPYFENGTMVEVVVKDETIEAEVVSLD